jgi:uncharacterized protein YcnI
MRLLLATLVLLLAPASALAHITVKPASARPGSTPALAFTVPNERDDAVTVGVAVNLPPGMDVVEVPPHTGWTSTVTGSEVAWALTRQAAGIANADSQDFAVTVGPLPRSGDKVVFKALQTYADGRVVRWIQAPEPDAERPAAVLELGSGDGGGSSSLGFLALAAVLVVAMGVGVLAARRRRDTG